MRSTVDSDLSPGTSTGRSGSIGSRPRHVSIKLCNVTRVSCVDTCHGLTCILSVKSSVNTAGSRAMKHWPRLATWFWTFHFLQMIIQNK